MIIGLGSDLCNIERIQHSLDRFGERFEMRVFTEVERAKAAKRPFTRAGTYAKRFAAKEAFSKAMGTGFRYPVTLQNISVVQNKAGKPGYVLSEALTAKMQQHEITGHYLTISDEKTMACAVAILEK